MPADTSQGFDLEAVVDLEQQFYDVGNEEGKEHGAIHGRIEGRELGRQKGFEMWEELGFYEGFAEIWRAQSEQEQSCDSRVMHSSQLLLDLIGQFPMKNPSHEHSADTDILKLASQIRSRYKVLCLLVGARPSLRAVRSAQQNENTSKGESMRDEEMWKSDASNKAAAAVSDYSF